MKHQFRTQRWMALLFIILLPAAAPRQRQTAGGLSAPPMDKIPPQAAARFQSDPGECLRFLYVYVPAEGGQYRLGLSFNYYDRDHSGDFTPGVDRISVCVNCNDSCGWGP